MKPNPKIEKGIAIIRAEIDRMSKNEVTHKELLELAVLDSQLHDLERWYMMYTSIE